MNRIYKSLKQHQNQKIKQVAQELLDSPDSEKLRSDICWIRDSSLLLDSMRKSDTSEKVCALVIGMLCLAIPALLWITPFSKIADLHISFKMQSSSVILNFAEDWSFVEPYLTTKVQIENLGGLAAPALGLNFEDRIGTSMLQVTGGKVELFKIGLVGNGSLELEADPRHLTFFLNSSKTNGELYLESHAEIVVKGRIDTVVNFAKKPDDPPELIEFYAQEKAELPTIVRLDVNESWRLTNLRVEELRFLKERNSASGVPLFYSTIKKGTILFHDVPLKREVRFEDVVTVQLAEVTRLEVEGTNEVNVSFEGKVKRIMIGPRGFERSLSPSLLEYFYRHTRFGFFWATVIAFWGILWSVRKTIFD